MTSNLGFESLSIERRIRMQLSDRSSGSLKVLSNTHPTEAIRNLAKQILEERGVDVQD